MRGKILTTWRFIGDVKRWLGRFKKGGKQDRKKGRLQINNGRSNATLGTCPCPGPCPCKFLGEEFL
jgi:hypothetical protein